MVVIKKISNIIPIDFGEFQLEYNANDKGVKNFDQYYERLQSQWNELQGLSDEEIAAKGRAVVAEGWEELFGPDAFDKVYQFAEEDTTIAFHYLIQTILGIRKEYLERNSEDTLKKYLA